MKKYLIAAFLGFSALSTIVVPISALAVGATGNCVNDGGIDDRLSSLFPTKFCSANELMIGIVKIILSISGMAAVLFIAIGGFRYITASQQGGGEKAITAARGMITNAIIGLVIVIFAYTLVTIVVNTVGGGDSGTPINQSGDPFSGGQTAVPCDNDPSTPTIDCP